MTTISVVSWVAGDLYQNFAYRWVNALRELERPPDRIVVGSDRPLELDGVDVLVYPEPFSPVLFNTAIAETDTDWVCKLDIDDLIFPHAFNGLDGWGSDVTVFGVKAGSAQWQPNGKGVCQSNAVTAASPFRRFVWEAAPFIEIDYWDWAFWIRAAKNGFTFAPTGTVDYEFVIHPGQVSATGSSHDQRVERVLRWSNTI